MTPLANSELTSLRADSLVPPEQHGQTLVLPPPAQWADQIKQNQLRFATVDPEFGDLSLSAIRKTARVEIARLAWEYTAQYTDIAPPPDNTSHAPLLMAGHQPELYHPGVWIKNFLLSAAAERTGGVAINMIVDNDVAGALAIDVPSRTPDGFQLNRVTLDPGQVAIPYEERPFSDDSPFWNADRTIAKLLQGLVDDPLANDLWNDARRHLSQLRKPAQLIPAMRHRLERSSGLRTLEIPIGRMTGTTAFGNCLSEWLHRAGDLREIHNRCLMDYRRQHRIRSRSHPVPELADEHGAIEVPFWIWSNTAPLRRRAFFIRRGSEFELTDLDRLSLRLPADDTARAWLELSEGSIRIRPRALITTLLARLFFSDLFIHGIGGAKYDQLLDAIIAASWGLEPPAYVTATATFLLPIDVDRSIPEQISEIETLLRDIKYHPENHVDHTDPLIQQIIRRKKDLLSASDTPMSGKERHQAIGQCNRELLKHLSDYRTDLQSRLAKLKRSWENQQLVHSREFSLCVHPESLPRTMRETVAAMPW